MAKAKIALFTVEEAFPSRFPNIEKIPVLGDALRATEDSFTLSAHYMRYKLGQRILKIAEQSGVDLTDKFQLESIGKITNDLTARGKTGQTNRPPGLINAIIWCIVLSTFSEIFPL